MRKLVYINHVLNKFGVEVYRLNTVERMTRKNSSKWLQHLNINMVLDIGANEGLFTEMIHSIIPTASIIAFEPLPECSKKLHELQQSIPSLSVIPYALGDEERERTIYRNAFLPSSSLLKTEKLHQIAFPYTKHTREELIKISTLDILLKGNILKRRILAKIDVQGYELHVLKGAVQTLPLIDIIIVETSYFSLYQDQSTFAEVYDFLTKKGFLFIGNFDQMYNPQNGIVLQGDAIFVNEPSLKILEES
ncbi:MAG: FkbM family methyltransferase [Bacteroidota bacterium]|nr:FkbM family methyltransferase [Bacteroidota bacterium]